MKTSKGKLLTVLLGGLLFAGCRAAVTEPEALPNEPGPEAIMTEVPAQEIVIDQIATATPEPISVPKDTPSPTPTETPTPEPTETPVPTPSGLLGGRYDVFSDGEVLRTEEQYVSDRIAITVTRYDSSPLTRHLVYFVADIYLQDIEALRTGSWDGAFGFKGKKSASFLKIARNEGAIAAITGDYYTYSGKGLMIRNGELIRTKLWAGRDVLLLYRDGTMEAFSSDAFDLDALDAASVWQAWQFGPRLLNEDGTARTSFSDFSDYHVIGRANPRTVFGYYEPGHYCFVTIDGRQSGYSNGLTLEQEAELMESLGCKLAFNLDGGQTSQFYWNDKIYNQPYKKGRFTSDIIYVAEPKAEENEPEPTPEA